MYEEFKELSTSVLMMMLREAKVDAITTGSKIDDEGQQSTAISQKGIDFTIKSNSPVSKAYYDKAMKILQEINFRIAADNDKNHTQNPFVKFEDIVSE